MRHRPSIRALAMGALAAVLFVGLVLSSRQHGSEIAVSGDQPEPLSAAEVRAANTLLAETTAGVARYQDAAVAIAAGYHSETPTSSLISQWINPSYEKASRLLDMRHPQRLLYVNGPGGPVLVGVIFVMPSAAVNAPTIGGPLMPWHPHVDYPLGSRRQPAPAILHVWIVYNPAGPFAADLSPRAIVRMLDGA